MASTKISAFPFVSLPIPDDYLFVLADPNGVHLSANYKVSYADIKAALVSSGMMGLDGEDGIDGFPGARGIQGVQGVAGSTGSTGLSGPAGLDGNDGEDGFPGIQGIRGIQGVQGIPGLSGTDGEDGLIGPPGIAGAAGANGTIGRDGAVIFLPSEDGEDGMPGVPGATGPQGIPGTAGGGSSSVIPGMDGSDGEDAFVIPGPQGIQGIPGGGGGGSATTVEVAMGTLATRGKFTITNASITAVSNVLCWQAPGPYTGKGTRADEAEMAPVRVLSVEPAAGSAVVKWESKTHVAVSPQAFDFKSGNGGRAGSLIAVVSNVIDNFKTNLQARVIGKVSGNIKFSYMIL